MASWQYVVALMLVITTPIFAVDCIFNGKTYKDGTKTTLTSTGPCVTYMCKNGNFAPSEVLCTDKDYICRRPGDTFSLVIGGKTYDNCDCTIMGRKIEYTCEVKRQKRDGVRFSTRIV